MLTSNNKKEIDKLREDYEELLFKQKEKTIDLIVEVETLKCKIQKLEADRERTLKTLESATDKSEEVRSQANAEYLLEMKKLKDFTSLWKKFYGDIIKKYPVNDELLHANQISQKISAILSEESSGEKESSSLEKAERLRKLFRRSQPQSSSFDMNEVLNPSEELDLKQLCLDLGL